MIQYMAVPCIARGGVQHVNLLLLVLQILGRVPLLFCVRVFVCVCVYTVCVQLMEQWHVLKTIHRYIVAGAY